ncbi:MAG: Fe-S cluster assembly protein SufD [Mariprofundaceae bacterium]
MSMLAENAGMEAVEAALHAAVESLPGDAAVHAHRRLAAASFVASGLPDRHDEDWKYTDIATLKAVIGERLWQTTASAPVDAAAIDAASIAELDAWQLVFVDGHFHPDLSAQPEGVRIHTLAELLQDELLQDNSAQGVEALAVDAHAPLFNGFTALNAALAADGMCICLAGGVRLDRPLHILHMDSGNGRVAHIRHAIALGAAAEAVIIEHFVGVGGKAGLTNVVTNIRLDEGANLQHYRLQQEAEQQFHVGRIDVRQAKDSRYISHAMALGAALSRADIVVNLAEAGAQCTLNGLYLLTGSQHADHHTRVDHAAPHCASHELYKGVLDASSRAVFNGKVVVHEGAEKTDAVQSNANLLLSDNAEIDTKPELEIYADDVKCAHGATVGQLDEEALFYLRSRGLAEATARNVLTYAFADDVLRRMGLEAVRQSLEHGILQSLPDESTTVRGEA